MSETRNHSVWSVQKKPVKVEAVQFTGTYESADAILNWIRDRTGVNPERSMQWVENVKENYLVIKTLEGNMTARPTDWIIRGLKGEFYPCRLDIFEESYDILGKVE